MRQAQNILMVGPSGTGKTCLAQAIGFEAIKLGFTVIYRSIFDIVSHLQRFNALSDRNPEFERYLKADLLIIDDMGLKQLPEKAGELLFEIIFRRHELKSTIMTSNRPLDDWGKLIGDVPTAGAILDRFLQQARLIPFKGKTGRPHFGRQGQARPTANDALLDAAAAARLDHAEGGSL
ncbi:ATP-binding protein [Oligosphaera ethanolica]|nr:ATP-binding protein [Oligosphaera ethanolica]